MGVLAGFIGGTARAAGQIADQRIARYTAEEMQRQRDLMDQEREKRIEEAQIARENRVIAQQEKDRTDRVSRIDAEAGRIADAQIAKQKGLIFEKEPLPGLTPDRLDAMDKEFASKRDALRNDNETKFQASINTGDTSQKDAQVLLDSKRRIDNAEKSQENAVKNAEMRDATERYKAQLKEEADKRRDETANKRIEMLFRSTQSKDKGNEKELLQFLGETRKSLQSEAGRLTDLMNSEIAANKLDPEAVKKIQADYKPKLDQLEIQQKNLTKDFNYARQKIGLPAAEDTKPSASTNDDPLAASIEAKLKELRGQRNSQPQTPITDPGSPTASTPAGRGGLISPKPVDTSAREAEIARMNALSGSSSNRANILSKKQDEIATNFDDKLSQIRPGMDRKQAFNVLSWFDDNSGYMTPAQLKQVRDAKRAAGM